MKLPITILLLILAQFAQAQTSKVDPRLQDALERFPEADANGDGVLTLEEAKAFKEKTNTPGSKDVGGGGIRSSYIYKTVGNGKLELFVDTPRGHKRDAKVPAIVFFHGGGFQTGSVNQFRTQSKYLADRGMVGIRVRYRLTRDKGVEVTDCIEDAISAMRWVRANAGKLGVDPNRIASGGGSAGGYLSIATLMIDFINAETDPAGVTPKPNAMVLFNPGIGGARKDGSPDPRDPEGKYDLNRYVKPNQPPTIIFHGKDDTVVPYASAEAFTAAMKEAGNRCDLVGYEGAGHSFFNQDKYYELTIAETDKFLTGLGWLEQMPEAR